MLKRPLFWVGLLLGGTFAAFGIGSRRQGPSKHGEPLLDLVSEAILICDSSGTVTYANAVAQSLFGPDGAGLARLCYPSGQRVPPGQLPQNRVVRTRKPLQAAGYRYLYDTDTLRVLDITATPLPAGGVTLVVCDRTALEELRAQEAQAETRQNALQSLCRRLNAAGDALSLAQAVAESALDLLNGLPDARAEVYTYNPAAQTLTRQAAVPADRPARPKSQRGASPQVIPFDASLPQHWQLYVAKESYSGPEDGRALFALPLIAGGAVIGHLAVTSPVSAAFEGAELCAALGNVASVAALALAGPQAAASAAHLTAQVEALRRIVQAVAANTEREVLADLITAQIQQVIGGEVCTLSVREDAGMRLLGTAYHDALLRPERHSPSDPLLQEKLAVKAMQTGKTVTKSGIANPKFEVGLWRAFAGQSGRHSVLAVPLANTAGVLTVCRAGTVGFSEPQIKFAETVAALVPVAG